MEKKLYRSANDRAVLGICGGIGEYLDVDPIIVRLIVVILTLLGFSGLLFYIIAIFVIPENPVYKARQEGRYYETTYEYTSGESCAAGSQGAGVDNDSSAHSQSYEYEVGPDGEVRKKAKDVSDYGREAQGRRKSGNSALILGLLLIATGAFVLLKIFLPWIDSRLFLAVGLILIGVLMIARK